jgi:hypothetical protein
LIGGKIENNRATDAEDTSDIMTYGSSSSSPGTNIATQRKARSVSTTSIPPNPQSSSSESETGSIFGDPPVVRPTEAELAEWRAAIATQSAPVREINRPPIEWSPQQLTALERIRTWYRSGVAQVFYLGGYAGRVKVR